MRYLTLSMRIAAPASRLAQIASKSARRQSHCALSLDTSKNSICRTCATQSQSKVVVELPDHTSRILKVSDAQ